MAQSLTFLRDSIAHKWGFGTDYALRQRIEKSILSARITIIQRRYDDTKVIPQSLIERVTCNDIITVDANECPCGCDGNKSKRSKNKVPKPLITKDDLGFNFVGRGFKPFSYVPFHQAGEIQYRPFSRKEIFYTYADGYLYFINANTLKEFDLMEVPEDLIGFLSFGTCQNSDCIQNNQIVLEDSLIEGIEGLLETRRPKIITGQEDTEIKVDE